MKRRARRCLGVDIGSTSLKIVELSQDRSGVIIQRLIEAPLDVAPDASSDTRWAAITQTLRDTLREQKISTRQAVLVLPGHAVFVRRVRLPRTTEERLHRIIRFEARQQIPFPLEQTLLQYQICSTDVEDEVEVLLVAIKREIVEQYMHMVRRLGLRPTRLGVSSFALYNFHMFDKGVEPEEFSLEEPARVEAVEEEAEEPPVGEAEKPAKGKGLLDSVRNLFGRRKKAAGKEEAVAEAEGAEPEPVSEFEEVKAFVNIGASTMDLAIGRTGGSHLIGFARSIPLAGNQLTRVIQDRCGCDSYAEAERIKREQTQVLLGSTPPPADRYNEQACRAIMPTIDRMVAEIRRSLDFYISQPDGMAVDRLVLSGGLSALPNLAAYFEDRLGIPVEVAREIHNPTCRSNVRAGADVTNFLIGIGMALQGLGAACITVDFLPEHLKGWIEFKRKNVQLAVQLAVMGAMLFLASQVGGRMSFLWSQKAREINAEVRLVEPMNLEYKTAQTQRGMLTGLSFTLLRSSAMSPFYSLDRDYVFRVLGMIQAIRPADVFFRYIEIGPNGELVMEGLAEQVRSAPSLTEALDEREEVLRAVLTRTPMPWAGTVGGHGRLYNFQVTAKLKKKTSKIEPTPTPDSRRVRPGEVWPGWQRTRPAQPGRPQRTPVGADQAT